MDVEAIKVYKGACYQNTWWVEEPTRKDDCAIQFWVYWEVLQDAAIVVPRVSPYATAYSVCHCAPLYLRSSAAGPQPIVATFGLKIHNRRVICYFSRLASGMV